MATAEQVRHYQEIADAVRPSAMPDKLAGGQVVSFIRRNPDDEKCEGFAIVYHRGMTTKLAYSTHHCWVAWVGRGLPLRNWDYECESGRYDLSYSAAVRSLLERAGGEG